MLLFQLFAGTRSLRGHLSEIQTALVRPIRCNADARVGTSTPAADSLILIYREKSAQKNVSISNKIAIQNNQTGIKIISISQDHAGATYAGVRRAVVLEASARRRPRTGHLPNEAGDLAYIGILCGTGGSLFPHHRLASAQDTSNCRDFALGFLNPEIFEQKTGLTRRKRASAAQTSHWVIVTFGWCLQSSNFVDGPTVGADKDWRINHVLTPSVARHLATSWGAS
jgi:hypothetical protein